MNKQFSIALMNWVPNDHFTMKSYVDRWATLFDWFQIERHLENKYCTLKRLQLQFNNILD